MPLQHEGEEVVEATYGGEDEPIICTCGEDIDASYGECELAGVCDRCPCDEQEALAQADGDAGKPPELVYRVLTEPTGDLAIEAVAQLLAVQSKFIRVGEGEDEGKVFEHQQAQLQRLPAPARHGLRELATVYVRTVRHFDAITSALEAADHGG